MSCVSRMPTSAHQICVSRRLESGDLAAKLSKLVPDPLETAIDAIEVLVYPCDRVVQALISPDGPFH
jgi:hypothetical protein